jgi:hypothetical protein
MEVYWPLLRFWLRPHCGISPKRLPYNLGFFEDLHNNRKRGHNTISALFGLLEAT